MSKYTDETKPDYLWNLEAHASKLRACEQMRRAMRTLEMHTPELQEAILDKERKCIQDKNSEICRTIESCGDRVTLLEILQDVKKFI